MAATPRLLLEIHATQKKWDDGAGMRTYARDLPRLLREHAAATQPTHAENLEDIIYETNGLGSKEMLKPVSPMDKCAMKNVKAAISDWVYKDETPPLTSTAAQVLMSLAASGWHVVAVDLPITSLDGRYGLTLDFVLISNSSRRLVPCDFTSLRAGVCYPMVKDTLPREEGATPPAVASQVLSVNAAATRRLIIINHIASKWFDNTLWRVLDQRSLYMQWAVREDPVVLTWSRALPREEQCNVTLRLDPEPAKLKTVALSVCVNRQVSVGAPALTHQGAPARAAFAKQLYARTMFRPLLRRWYLYWRVCRHLALRSAEITARRQFLASNHLAGAEADELIDTLTPEKKLELTTKDDEAIAAYNAAAGEFFRDRLRARIAEKRIREGETSRVWLAELIKNPRAGKRQKVGDPLNAPTHIQLEPEPDDD
jgi:hypothetical protein